MRGRVSGHRGQEIATLQCKQLGIDGCPDGRSPRHVVQQRDLPEVITSLGTRPATGGVDLELSVPDDVEAVSAIAGADDHVPCGDRNRNETCRDPFLRGDRKRL